MSALLYLYGFAPGDAAAPPADLRGVDGGDVMVLPLSAFAAVVSSVEGPVYRAGALEARLKDLEWVGSRGVEHERVVTWFADNATIVPARLLTLFSSEGALRAEADARSEAVTSALSRFRHAREWDLKVSYDRATLAPRLAEVSDEAAKIAAEIDAAAPGRRYLLERKREELLRREAPRAARALASELLDEARAFADEVKELELPARREGLPVVLDAALLVQPERVDGLRKRVSDRTAPLAERGIHVSLTGPWAPYRFLPEDRAS